MPGLLWTPGNTDTNSQVYSEHADRLQRVSLGPNSALTELLRIKNNSDTNLEELTINSEISLLFLWLSLHIFFYKCRGELKEDGNSAGQEAAHLASSLIPSHSTLQVNKQEGM